jgi:transcription elongation factor GreA
MTSDGQNQRKKTLGEVVTEFETGLPEEERKNSQPDVTKFARWFGWERSLAELTPPVVGDYADRLSLSDTDYANKLELVRAFLTWLRNKGFTATNLAVHLKPKKAKGKIPARKGPAMPENVLVTEEGFAKLKAELQELIERRPKLIEDITRAAADKDFRENAPLEAAREQHGLVEGRIREIEAILKRVEIVNNNKASMVTVCVGDEICLIEVATGAEMVYKIVGPREADPSKGKISGVSPVGKAVVGKKEGAEVDVIAPMGKICYRIKQIKR